MNEKIHDVNLWESSNEMSGKKRNDGVGCFETRSERWTFDNWMEKHGSKLATQSGLENIVTKRKSLIGGQQTDSPEKDVITVQQHGQDLSFFRYTFRFYWMYVEKTIENQTRHYPISCRAIYICHKLFCGYPNLEKKIVVSFRQLPFPRELSLARVNRFLVGFASSQRQQSCFYWCF